MNPKVYPFNKSLRNRLDNIESASLGIRLMKAIMTMFSITQTEAELLICAASYSGKVRFLQFCEDVNHLTADTTRRRLGVLVKANLITTQQVIDHDEYVYQIADSTRQMLKTIELHQLENIDPTKYEEAIYTPVELDVNELAEPDYPVIPMELDSALSFCYALLAPGQNANDILKANADKALAAHRAIYERRPQPDSYDDMMANLYGDAIPLPGPLPTPPAPKMGLIKTLAQAVKQWRANR
jgi:DNA-binding HxlR family transcriptional regulator